MHNKILILDFGSQYTQLIARRVRELNVYCEIHPYNKYPELDSSIKGVILSGSPFSVHDAESPKPDLNKIKGKLPLLGVCFGAQYMANTYGGKVMPSQIREYGRAMLDVANTDCPLFKGVNQHSQVWMSHGDTITEIPSDFVITAGTQEVKVGAYHIKGEETYGIQFHPEVYHTTEGLTIAPMPLIPSCLS